ncbi:MAG: hypothetical protein QOJ65_2294, partial [Fimbriimonadaceae bacterium]|nr:hypothetical protein [Fimbriimonadaceae bacterium]
MFSLALAFTLAHIQGDWSTHYERSGYLETGRYEEAVDYCKRLDAASPDARAFFFGKSPEGRDMVALVISSEHAFTPKAATRSSRPLIIVQNGIHSGEIEGKDASLLLARDMLIYHKFPELMNGANILIIPVFSVDAHERFTAYTRINQNGPKEMGWRATSQNLNLNRDYIKADGGEMRNELKLLHAWKPDFFFDNHTTDGSDHQYTVTLALPVAQTQAPSQAAWSQQMYDEVKTKLDAKGFLTGPYFDLADSSDPAKGLSVGDYSPRYSIGYLAAMNRPSMLVETHVLKAYKPRVEGTYWTMVYAIDKCVRDAKSLKAMNAASDAAELKAGEGTKVVLSAENSPEKRPFTFKAYEYTPYESKVSGAKTNNWNRSKPIDIAAQIQDQYQVNQEVSLPAAYAVPPQWKEVQDLIALHGIKGFPVRVSTTTDLQSYRFTKVKFSPMPFESRFMPQFTAEQITEPRTLMPGTMIYPVNQVGGKLLAQMLEPNGPDSLVRWGFFNVMFEGKEYFEDYAMEPVAKQMYDSDPKLRAEFEERLKDEAFAKNPR